MERVLPRIQQNDPSLTVADLKLTDLRDQGAKNLAKALEQNTTLTSLLLGSCNVGDAEIKTLCEVLHYNKHITSIELPFNSFSNEGGKALLELVEKNRKIIDLQISGNSVDESIETKIFKAIKANRERNEKPVIDFPKERENKKDKEKEKEKSDKKRPGSSTKRTSGYSPSLSSSTTSLPTSSSLSASSSSKKISRDSSNSKLDGFRADERDKDEKKEKNRSKQELEELSSNSSSSLRDFDQIATLKKRIQELEDSESRLSSEIIQMKLKQQNPGLSRGDSKQAIFRKKEINLDNVQVNERLAETGGSSATVFNCFVDGWSCAMKEMDIKDLGQAQYHAFESEILILEELPYHPNITRYLFHDRTRDKMRLFMTKYACSLRNILTERRKEYGVNNCPFRPRELVKYLLDIIKGLDFLHSHKIIHRDLKSDNIFVTLTERKEISTLAIGDFDTAKKLNQGVEAKTVIGTPGYIAPEVLGASNTGNYDYKADIYGFGMIVYEMLTLKMPYEDCAYPWLITGMVMKGERPSAPVVSKDLLPLVQLYERCTMFKPETRFELMQIKEFLFAL